MSNGSRNIPRSIQQFYRFMMKIRPTILTDLLKKALRIQRVLVDSKEGSFWVDPISHMGQSIINNDFEPNIRKLIKAHLSSGQLFIDVGANEGFYSIMAARQILPHGRVIAIEPQKRLTGVIQDNARVNQLENITIVHCAVGDGTINQVELWLSPSTMTGASSIVRKYRLALKEIVHCKTLAQIFDEQSVAEADFVKIDVEGFEAEVIYGAAELLAQKRIKFLLIDYHGSILEKRQISAIDLHNLLESLGYRIVNGNFCPSGYNLYESADI